MPLPEKLAASLSGRYTIERELGGGGMSRVFLAEEVELGRKVVIKLMAPELAEGLSAERFAREVKLAARLQQANIVPLLSAGVADGVPWYTMPFVRGESLRARLSRGEQIPLSDAMSILRDVARALAFSHAEGAVHRDIKPENILLSGGTAVVTDFGIAKAVSASRTEAGVGRPQGLTVTGSTIGTPAYMAPEQSAGDPGMDHRADLYAWGVVAWELLAGRHPFATATTPRALLAAHMSEAPASVNAARSEVPPSLAALVMRCLEKDPARRPATATEILQLLDQVTTPSAASVDATRQPGANKSRRWMIGAAALVVIIGGVWVLRAVTDWRGVAADTTRTVVVLPFDNLGSSSDAYFVDGLSEEIASRLGQIPGIRVLGRASAARLKAANRTPDDIAREMGAEYVLTGSVRWDRASGAQAGDATVRITPALLRAKNAERLWGEPITEKVTDVFKVQADVAERVAKALSVSLAAATRTSIHRADTKDPDARDAVLVGSNLVARRGEANIRQAVVHFRRAIARDSNYARAWAGLAEAQAVGPNYGVMDLDSTDAAARRAVALDSLSPEAWTALATTLYSSARYRESLAATDRALTLDPSNAAAHSRRGMILLAMGRVAEAEAPLRTAAQLDPLVGAYNARIAFVDLALSRRDSAMAHVQRTRVVDPMNTALMVYAGPILLQLGLTDLAVENCLIAARPGEEAHCHAFPVIADPARRAEAVRIVDDWAKPGAPSLMHDPAVRASFYAHLGETDKAFEMIRTALTTRGTVFFGYINSPWMMALKRDPRWQSIVVAAQAR